MLVYGLFAYQITGSAFVVAMLSMLRLRPMGLFGAFLGAMLPGGRKTLRTTRLVIGSMSAGTTQLAVTAIAAHVWAIPETLILPLLLGSLLIEFTAPARRQFARHLAEMEAELEE